METLKDKSVNKDESKENRSFRSKAAAFLMGLSGISIISGFGYTIGVARKSDPDMFDKGMVGSRNIPNAGSTLALRALGWGTIYAVSGVTLFCCLVWKVSGANNMQEFRLKVGNILPTIRKSKNPEGRTEFDSLSDLFQYIIDEDTRIKQKKLESQMPSSEPQK